MPLEQIQTLLHGTMGLDVRTVGSGSLERAVRTRMAACKERDVEAYWMLLHGSRVELQQLIETIAVPETWFFRDRGAYIGLARLALEASVRAESGEVMRILSVPCSTGEEPFSIAMALLDAGLLPHRFQIDAIDISQKSIERAQAAVYGRNSFRGHDVAFRERYFEPVGDGWRITEAVRKLVRFRADNLFTCGATSAAAAFDVIFCRNLLIYFDRPTQTRALNLLGYLLRQDGVLFVGPSESGLLLDEGFVSARMPMAFGFRRSGSKRAVGAGSAAGDGPARLAKVLSLPARKPRRAAVTPKPLPRVPAERPAVAPAAAVSPPPPANALSWIDEAQRLADEGKLVEAMKCCERHLREDGTSTDGTYLMALLHDAAGDTGKAREHYRKTVYLDPSHHEALVHLAIVLRQEGDERGARQMFERAKRASGASGAAAVGGAAGSAAGSAVESQA